MTAPTADTTVAPSVMRLATEDVPLLTAEDRVGDVHDRLWGGRFSSARDLPVCDVDRSVVGVVRIEDLLAASDEVVVRAIMDADPPTLAADTDPEVAAWRAVRDGESSLILVDTDRRFVGLVPPDRLLDVLLREHEEDVARLGGFVASGRAAEHATRESVSQRLAHRLPWLLLGLGGALAAAGLMSGFEGLLRDNLTLALFVPGIVYLADAVGTQTETLVIRGLALGVRIHEVFLRELVTGVLAGVALGVLFVPVGLLVWGDGGVVATVALSVAAACATANVVAMLLPGLFDRLGVDPAFGSGPLATVVQDLLSIAIYLGVAVLVAP